MLLRKEIYFYFFTDLIKNSLCPQSHDDQACSRDRRAFIPIKSCFSRSSEITFYGCPYFNFCFTFLCNKDAASCTLSSLSPRASRVTTTGADTTSYSYIS